jgi:hypothetical protein
MKSFKNSQKEPIDRTAASSSSSSTSGDYAMFLVIPGELGSQP